MLKLKASTHSSEPTVGWIVLPSLSLKHLNFRWEVLLSMHGLLLNR